METFWPSMMVWLLLATLAGCSLGSRIRFETDKSIVYFDRLTPTVDYHLAEGGKETEEYFRVDMDFLRELTPNGDYVGLSLDLTKLPFLVTSSSDNPLFNVINYTISDGSARLTFQIMKQDLVVEEQGFNKTLIGGSVKFSMFLLKGWPFTSPNSTLRFSANITAPESISTCSQGGVASQDSVLTCRTGRLTGALSLLLGALVISPIGAIEQIAVKVKYALHAEDRNSTKEGVDLPVNKTGTIPGKGCEGQPINHVFIQILFPAFFGGLAYDPDLSVFFSGGTSGPADGCGSSGPEVSTIFWISLGFVGAACIISALIILCSRAPFLVPFIFGKEGKRIQRGRVMLRRRTFSDANIIREQQV